MCLNAMRCEQLQGLRTYVKPAQHALGQQNGGGAVIEQLGDISGLYARLMSSAGFIPISI